MQLSKHQTLIVEFDYPFEDLDPLFDVELRLEQFIRERRLGEYDGNEIGLQSTDARIYMYSPDVRELLRQIRPILHTVSFMKNASAMMRLGPLDEPAPIIEVKI